MARGLARNAQIWHELYRPNSRQRTVAVKTQAGPDAALSPSPAQPSVAGFGFFVGCNQLLRRFWGMNVGCGGILASPLGVVLRAANQDNNDCRWQSYLCFVPRSGKGGVIGIFELLPFIGQHPLSLAPLDSSPIGEPSFPCCPLWWKCRGSGKGGVVGNFGLVPFNEQHPLSLALLDSSPTGEPRELLRIRLGFHKAVSACCKPLSQARWACQLPVQGRQGDQAFSSKCMDRDLKRVSITCLAVARMSTWAT